jgi:molybdate transport system substrate-binding protein
MKTLRTTWAARLVTTAILAMLVASSVPVPLAASASGSAVGRAPAAKGDARPEIAFYASASLRDVLGELKPGLEKAAGATLVFNFGGSNDLARQIMAADKADLFISADEGWMDKVSDEGLVNKASRRSLLSNRLVVVAPRDSTLKIASAEDLTRAGVAKIAMADPEAVPAGKYAKEWLEKKGQWSDALKAKVLSTADVRAALAAVASGNVDAGVVYKTDAAISSSVRVVYEVPAADAPKISYPIAVMAHSAHAKEASAAAEYLEGPEAQTVFERFGFIVTDAAVKR